MCWLQWLAGDFRLHYTLISVPRTVCQNILSENIRRRLTAARCNGNRCCGNILTQNYRRMFQYKFDGRLSVVFWTDDENQPSLGVRQRVFFLLVRNGFSFSNTRICMRSNVCMYRYIQFLSSNVPYCYFGAPDFTRRPPLSHSSSSHRTLLLGQNQESLIETIGRNLSNVGKTFTTAGRVMTIANLDDGRPKVSPASCRLPSVWNIEKSELFFGPRRKSTLKKRRPYRASEPCRGT